MTEKPLKAKLVSRMRDRQPANVVFRHEDLYAAGIPDISVTGWRNTLWIEVKALGTKKTMQGRGIQRHTMERLAAAGLAVYVVYTKLGVIVQKVDGTIIGQRDGKDRHDYAAGVLYNILKSGEYLATAA